MSANLAVYEIINPSDAITVKASPDHAALLATILAESWMFLRPVDGGDMLRRMSAEAFKARRDRMDADTADLVAYAAVFHSATVGAPRERAAIDAKIEAFPAAERLMARRAHNQERATSMRNICGPLMDAGDRMVAEVAQRLRKLAETHCTWCGHDGPTSACREGHQEAECAAIRAGAVLR